MKIIIVENELYLAQSIASKLNENSFETEIYSSVKEAMKNKNKSKADVYLLSTNMPGQNITPFIKEFKDKIVILMVSYINNDTVSLPLKLGAKDYIVKPFMIEELLRKIEHYQEYQGLRQRTELYKKYIENLFKEIQVNNKNLKINPPMVIQTNYQRLVDKVVFAYAKESNKLFSFITLNEKGWKEKIINSPSDAILYITEIESLKKSDKETLLEMIKKEKFILCATEEYPYEFDTITLNTESKLYDQNEILTIDDYVKFIINNFQYKFPDTELSKKLGISRKSLWEKRKKYELFKKK